MSVESFLTRCEFSLASFQFLGSDLFELLEGEVLNMSLGL